MSATIWASGCELAGRLAEMGVASATLIEDARERVLAARETDLPRELFGVAEGSRLVWAGGEAVRDDAGWRVVAAGDAQARG